MKGSGQSVSDFTPVAGAASLFGVDEGHQGLSANAETGLVYNRHRYLHVTLGRFTSPDPHPQGRYVDGMNGYEYVRGGPVAAVDPSGLSYNSHPQDPLFQHERLWERRHEYLDRWNERQYEQLARRLEEQCPEDECPYKESRQACLEEARRIARAIVDAIDNVRRKRLIDQHPGNLGNYTGGNQCDDWRRITERAAYSASTAAGRGRFFKITRVNAERTRPFPQWDVWHGESPRWRQVFHNWTEVSTNGSQPVVIDPWPTGGREIVDSSYSEKANTWPKVSRTDR
jgi:RHS repeat-associated protein